MALGTPPTILYTRGQDDDIGSVLAAIDLDAAEPIGIDVRLTHGIVLVSSLYPKGGGLSGCGKGENPLREPSARKDISPPRVPV
jgi:hypothetical protein